jgi:hypothetical protein
METMKALASVLLSARIRSLNISDNNIFSVEVLGSGGNRMMKSDAAGWHAICEALHDSSCVVEEFYAARIRLGPLRLKSLFSPQVAGGEIDPREPREFPQRISRLDLSGNYFAACIPFQVPANVRALNPDRGGAKGTNGWTKLCGIDKKIPVGVVLTNGPCDRILKVKKREETWKKNDATRPEDQVLDVFDTFMGDLDELRVTDALQKYDAYDPREVYIGSYITSKWLWSVLDKRHSTGCNLVHLELVDCEMDAKAVLQLACAVKSMDLLETMRMSSTGAGPWRGRFGIRVPLQRQDAKVYELKLTGDSNCQKVVELADCGVGPEDACLISAWMTRPKVREKWSRVNLSGSNVVFGNKKASEDDEKMVGLGEHRILTPRTMFLEGFPSTGLKPATTNLKFAAGDVIEISESVKFEAEFLDGKRGKRTLECLHLRYDTEHKKYNSSHHYWVNSRDTEGTVVVKRVRNHEGWNALCEALAECHHAKPRRLVLDVSDGGMGDMARRNAKTRAVQVDRGLGPEIAFIG